MDELFFPDTLIGYRMTVAGFWEVKALTQMSPDEWESLCDGCGLCCLVKIEDEESGEVFNTTVSCQQLDTETCRCRAYENRLNEVAMCIQLTPKNISGLNWLPETCAYKCLHENRPLPDWHPLITKDKDTVHNAGISIKWFAQSEKYVHPEQLMDFVIKSNEK